MCLLTASFGIITYYDIVAVTVVYAFHNNSKLYDG